MSAGFDLPSSSVAVRARVGFPGRDGRRRADKQPRSRCICVRDRSGDVFIAAESPTRQGHAQNSLKKVWRVFEELKITTGIDVERLNLLDIYI